MSEPEWQEPVGRAVRSSVRVQAPCRGGMTHVGGAWIVAIDIGSAGVTGPTRRA